MKGLGANAFHVHSLVRHYENCEQYKQAMNDKISEAAGLLRQASDMLLTVVSPSTSALSEGSTESRPMLHSVVESVSRTRYLMDRSRDGGTFRRLGCNERLRSQIPRGGAKSKPKRPVPRIFCHSSPACTARNSRNGGQHLLPVLPLPDPLA